MEQRTSPRCTTRRSWTGAGTGLALTAEYSAPSAGPPPWHVYRITLRSATALQTVEPGGATRWRF